MQIKVDWATLEIIDTFDSDRVVGLNILGKWIGRSSVNEHINYLSKSSIEKEI